MTNSRRWEIIEKSPGLWMIRFEAMRSPCEVWLETESDIARDKLIWAANEAWRVEEKYSRFNQNSVLSKINSAAGEWQSVDDETYALLTFADQAWQLTDGQIDVTIGGFLSLWRFDGKSLPPTRTQLKNKSQYVGWQKVSLKPNQLYLPKGMSLDFGGIGKEYVVDKIAFTLAGEFPGKGVMVNFGGDVMCSGAKSDGSPWTVGIENNHDPAASVEVVSIYQGAITTSGDVKRYAINKNGKVLGHILSPKTGWPVPNGPATVTVMAQTATQSGLLSTLAMLQGKQAESFLKEEEVRHWVQYH